MITYPLQPLLLQVPEALAGETLLVAAGPPAPDTGPLPHWTLPVQAVEDLAPPGRAPDTRFDNLSLWRTDRGLCIASAGGPVHVDHDPQILRVPRAVLAPERPTRGIVPALRLALAYAASRRGALVLHAGLVVHPSLGRILIPGGSGAGKSTTTASLLLAGAAFATDEIVLALPPHAQGEHPLRAWPTFLHLDPFTAALLRRHHIAVPDASGRLAWDARNAFPAAPRHAGLPDLLVLPCVAPDRPCHATPLAPAQALAQLLYAAPVLPLLEPDARAEQHRLAAALVRDARAAHLQLGNDLAEQPDRLVPLLRIPEA